MRTFKEMISGESVGINEASNIIAEEVFADIMKDAKIVFEAEYVDKEGNTGEISTQFSEEDIGRLFGSTKMWDNLDIIKMIRGDKDIISKFKKYVIDEGMRYTFDSKTMSFGAIKNAISADLYAKTKVFNDITKISYKKHIIFEK